MDNGAFLATVAQVAVTLAGFGGVLNVFNPPDDATTSRGRLLIVEVSFMTLFGALLPHALESPDREITWLRASWGLAILMIGLGGRYVRQIAAMRSRRERLGPLAPLIFLGTLGAAIVSQLAIRHTEMWYELALLFLVFMICYQFWLFAKSGSVTPST
jgi:cation transport ATPase